MAFRSYQPSFRRPTPADPKARTLRVVARHFVWQAPNNESAILAAQDEDTGDEVTLKGPVAAPMVNVGDVLEVHGFWKNDTKYGWGFIVQDFQKSRPATLVGIEGLLLGLHGVGPAFAKKIVNHFGLDTIEVLDNNPERLTEIPGVGPAKVKAVAEKWDEERATRRVMQFLKQIFGVNPTDTNLGPKLAARLYQAYGEQTIAKLKENPYQITSLDRVGFTTADAIALAMGVPQNDRRRIDAGIQYVLDMAEGTRGVSLGYRKNGEPLRASGGHCYLTLAQMLTATGITLKVEDNPELIAERVLHQAQAGKIQVDLSLHGERLVYSKRMHRAETRLADKLRQLADTQAALVYPSSLVRPDSGDFIPTDEQWQAIEMALKARLTILTGGPGTGKCQLPQTPVVVNHTIKQIGQLWKDYAGTTEFDGEGYWAEPTEPLFVPAITGEGKMVQARVTKLYRQKVKETGRRVALQDGSSVEMTQAHRLLGVDDWVRDISPGDLVCVPGVLPHGNKQVDPDLIDLFGWMVSEGFEQARVLGGRQDPDRRSSYARIYQNDVARLKALQAVLERASARYGFPAAPQIVESEGKTPYLKWASVGFERWATEQGYDFGQRSAGKALPDFLLAGDEASARRLLRVLFAAEGSVQTRDGVIEFTSASRLLVDQVSMLLRRFGIWMRIARKEKCATNGKQIKRTYWTGYVSGSSLRRFQQMVGIDDPLKQAKLDALATRACNDNLELIPYSELLHEAKATSGLSRHHFGLTSSYFSSTKNPGRATATAVLERTQQIADGRAESAYQDHIASLTGRGGHRYKAQTLEAFASMDYQAMGQIAQQMEQRLEREVFYTKVASVEPIELDGWVYDLEVETHHNYVAGGAITHNTASTKMLCDVIDANSLHIELCAPTGKAAKRISEATGHPAKTIHRLLKWEPQTGGFVHHQGNPVQCDVMVVDETSMVDVLLMDKLMQAVGPKTHVVLVGDVDQLPPVGPGKTLQDIITARRCPTIRLTKVFRQAARSMIIQAAYAINRGEWPNDDVEIASKKAGAEAIQDYFWIARTANDDIRDLTVSYACHRIPREYGFDPLTDVQVIAPMSTTEVGVDALNYWLQQELNPQGEPIGFKRTIKFKGEKYDLQFRVGDKLLNTKNDYNNDVMNGEFARLISFDPAEELVTLDVDGREIVMGARDAHDNFVLAYATTVHKMQGSSAKAVVIPLSKSFNIMLTRNLLYTAITRSERLCMVIGHPQAMSTAVREVDTATRNTALAERLLHPSLSGQLV